MLDKIITKVIQEVCNISTDDIKESIISELEILTETVVPYTSKGIAVEGVADKAAEKMFNIADPNTQMDRQAVQAMGQTAKEDPKGLFMGNTNNQNIKYRTNVFLNPKSLRDFEADVKAVSNNDGDLFVAQSDVAIYHSDIVNAVDSGEVYHGGYIGNAYDGQDTITWHRIHTSDDFGFSVSYLDFNKQPENHQTRDKLMQAVRRKNPKFNFLPFYWREEYNRRFDDENNYNNNSLNNYDDRPQSYPIYSNRGEIGETTMPNRDDETNVDMPVEIIHEGWNENLLEGIDVWHGSTEKFNRFDMQKVGSGDGKSLGGWGIYFSENPEVSKQYYLPKGQLKQHEIRSGNYFDLDGPLEDGERILQALERQGVDEDDLQEFRETYVDNNYSDTSGKQAYDWLSFVLGGEMQASKFLESIGYIGNTMMDKWEPDSRNYVVFDTKSIIN